MKAFIVAVSAIVSFATLNAAAAELPALQVKREVHTPDYTIDLDLPWIGEVKLNLGWDRKDEPSIEKPNKAITECFTKQQDALRVAFENPKNASYLQDPGIHQFNIDMRDNTKGKLAKKHAKELNPRLDLRAGKYSSTVMNLRAGVDKDGTCHFMSAKELTSGMEDWLVHYGPLKKYLASFANLFDGLNTTMIKVREAAARSLLPAAQARELDCPECENYKNAQEQQHEQHHDAFTDSIDGGASVR